MGIGGKIIGVLRELKLVLSLIMLVGGLIVFFLSITHFVLQDYELEFMKNTVGEWNAYLVAIGFIMIITGVIYLNGYVKNRKFILEELETNKRSEFLKRQIEVRNKVKHMPKKYKKMLDEKEEELKLK